MASTGNQLLSALFAKKEVTVLVTDSGLGGMGILAEIADRFRRDPVFPKVSLIYYNAWPEQNRGYNALKDMAERIRVFDKALAGMQRYHPDIILIACHTLSVLYDRTAFSRQATIPVIDIVRFGVDLAYAHLVRAAADMAVIWGTVTTIATDVHRRRLIAKGIAPNRLIGQPCDQLATQIEKGPQSETVVRLIKRYAEQTAQKLAPGQTNVLVALFCTHFGYSRELIKSELESRIQRPVTILDPNRRMAALLFEAGPGKRHGKTQVEIEVVSRIAWDQAKTDAIATIIEKQSSAAARALRSYQQNATLFAIT